MEDNKKTVGDSANQSDPKNTAPKRRYRYIGPATEELVLPNLSGSINPNTVTDDRIDKLIQKHPSLSKLFEKI